MHTAHSSLVLGTTVVVRDWLVPTVWVGKCVFVMHTFIPQCSVIKTHFLPKRMYVLLKISSIHVVYVDIGNKHGCIFFPESKSYLKILGARMLI